MKTFLEYLNMRENNSLNDKPIIFAGNKGVIIPSEHGGNIKTPNQQELEKIKQMAQNGFHFEGVGENKQAGAVEAKWLENLRKVTKIKSFHKWLFENDYEHAETLRKTGFWGKQGSGAIILAKDTGRILLPHRSHAVLEPNTWGTWGGAIDSSEDPKTAAQREVEEEAGYSGNAQMIPLAVFSKDTFRYYNFLAIVDHEFDPELNWETQDFAWVEFGDWPSPLHPGLKWLLSQDSNKIKDIIEKVKTKN